MSVQTERKLAVGEHVIFHDPHNKPHNALVTAVWGPKCCNLLYVSSDESRTDGYGRQVERQSSFSHGSVVQAHGMYWRYPGENPNVYHAPEAV